MSTRNSQPIAVLAAAVLTGVVTVALGFVTVLHLARSTESAEASGRLLAYAALATASCAGFATYALQQGKRGRARLLFAATAVGIVAVPALQLVALAVPARDALELVLPPDEPLGAIVRPDAIELRHPSLGFVVELPARFEPDPQAGPVHELARTYTFTSENERVTLLVYPALSRDGFRDYADGLEEALRGQSVAIQLARFGDGVDAEVRLSAVGDDGPVVSRTIFVPTPGQPQQMTPVSLRVEGGDPDAATAIAATLRPTDR